MEPIHIYSFSAILCARLARAAARSNWPGAPLGLTAPGRGALGASGGLEAVGTGGLPGAAFGAPVGFGATGGGGAGFFPIGGAGGGGFAPTVLDGREGVVPADRACGLFHGAAVPLDGAMPGKTDTGFAEAFAVMDCSWILGCGVGAGAVVGFEATTGAAGRAGGRRAVGGGGGGGGGAGATFGFGGTSSR